jgi:hypothetical protein
VSAPLQPTAAAGDDLVSAPLILDARAVREPDDVLSPARVAAAAFSSTLVDAPAPAAIDTDQDKAERLSRALNEELRAAAAELRHLSRRPPPKLERLHDGSYRWEGPLFNAHVAPDGMVSFDDAPDFIVDGFGIGPFMIGNDPRRGRAPEPPSFSMYLRELPDYLPILKLFGHFDLEAALARARRGDPHVAERLWFLQQTETLRRDLAATGLAFAAHRCRAGWVDTPQRCRLRSVTPSSACKAGTLRADQLGRNASRASWNASAAAQASTNARSSLSAE